jgi:hypothetical protein
MDQDRFESEVVAMASEGTRLTVANVAARTRLAPRKAEQMLDAMVRAQTLESEIDEREGLLIYVVRGLDPAVAARSKLARLEREVTAGASRAARAVLVSEAGGRVKGALTAPGEKSVLAAGILGLIFGPFGLLYAAPFEEVAWVSLGYAGLWLLSKVWIIGVLFMPLLGVAHLVFAALCAMYAMRFNQSGKRTPLLPAGDRDRR